MSRLEKESARVRGAAGRAAGSGRAVVGSAVALSGVAWWLLPACLPTEDLSSYSSSYRRAEPAIALEESAAPGEPGGPASELSPGLAPGSGEAAAPGPEPLAGECNGDCVAPELPLLVDAGSPVEVEPEAESGGTVSEVTPVAPNDVPGSEGDAGVAPPAPPPPDAAPPGPCGQGALLSEERCFALVVTPSTWADAREACEERGPGWDLAVIRGSERNSLLAGMLAGVTDAWVGANDIAQEGSWRWVGDTNPFFTGTGTAGSAAAGAFVNWNTGGAPEPNGGAASDCLRLRANGGWADIACTSTFAALCEGPQP